jgi:hypothetical protein
VAPIRLSARVKRVRRGGEGGGGLVVVAPFGSLFWSSCAGGVGHVPAVCEDEEGNAPHKDRPHGTTGRDGTGRAG